MKNVLHIIGGLDRGGAESFLMNTIRSINRSKYTIIIAVFMPPVNGSRYAHQNELDKLGIKTIKIVDNRFKKPIRFTSDIRKIIKAEKINIVHSHIDFMSALTLIGAFRGGVKKRIAHSHNTNNSRITSTPKKLISSFMRLLINIFATNKISCGQDAGAFLFGKNKNFTVIPNGINIDKFKFNKSARTSLRRKYNISPKDPVLLNVGRLEKQKNQSYLIDIFKHHTQTHPSAFLFIIGDGSLRKKLEDKVSKLGLSKKVMMLPALSNIHEYYSMADYFLLPSLFEGVPIAGIEAQANGLKCLFSSYTPQETALTNNAQFLNIDSASVSLWTNSITSPPSESHRTKNHTDPKITAYDISKTIKKLEKIYDSK